MDGGAAVGRLGGYCVSEGSSGTAVAARRGPLPPYCAALPMLPARQPAASSSSTVAPRCAAPRQSVPQVVDARDPLTYRSEDLERYALDLHPTKRSLLLLNKADLLPEALRSAWADHLDALGCDYVFWSAKAGMDEHSTGAGPSGAGSCVRARARVRA